MKQGLTLIGHHRALFSNRSLIKLHKPLILNLSASRCFYESFVLGFKFQSKISGHFEVFPSKAKDEESFWHSMSMVLNKEIYF